MKRLLSLLLVLCMLTFAAISCEEDNIDGPPPPDIAAKYELPESVGDRNFDGYEFRILTVGSTGGSHWSAFEFHYDGNLSGDTLNEAVKTRDSEVAALFNVKISYVEKSNNELRDYARQAILSDSDEFDLVTAAIRQAGVLACEGMFADMREYEDILNLDAEYWDRKAVDSHTIDGKLYFAVNDLTQIDKQATNVIFFTKSMLAKYPSLTEGYENGLYTMVEKGEWTVEKMYNMVKAVSLDNGDGVQTYEDAYGLGGKHAECQSALMVGCGAIGVRKNSAGVPEYVLQESVDVFTQCFGKVYEMVNNQNNCMTSGMMLSWYEDGDIWVKGYGSMMEKNNLLFHLTNMNRCRLFRELECDFGIIPLPKANDEQEEYYSMIPSEFANSVAIPVNVKDKERACCILEALTCIANKTTYYAYIEQSLKSKYLRDDDSEAMLDLIFDSRVYDLGDIFSYGDSHFGAAAVAGALSNPEAVASTLKKTQSRNEKALKRVLEDYRSGNE